MKIKYKFFIAFLVTSLTLTGITTFIFYYVTKNYFEFQVNQQVRSLTQAKIDSVDVFLRAQRDTITTAVLSLDLKNILSDKTGSEAQKIKLADSESRMDVIMSAGSSYIYSMYVIDSDGIVIMTTNKDIRAQHYQQDLDHVKAKRAIHFEPIGYCHDSLNTCLSGALPIFNDRTGEFEGALVMDFSLDILNSSMLGLAGMGKTGDSYLIDDKGTYLTESRFSAHSSLRQQASRSQMENCNQNLTFGMDLEKIYIKRHFNNRGIEVLSSCVHVPDSNWFLVLEITTEEALSFMDNVLMVALLLVVLVLIFCYFFAVGFSRQLIDPIVKLQVAVQAVEKGDWTQEVVIKSKDELGLLSQVFNRMIKALSINRRELDKQVAKQTKEINVQKQDLYDQQRAVLNILEDIEDEKAKADTEREKLDTVVQGISDGVFVVDASGKIILFNRAAESMSGQSAIQAIGHQYNQVFNLRDESNDQPLADVVNDAISTSQVQRLPDKAILVRADGVKMAVSGNVAPLWNHEGSIMGCTVVIRDVSHEREVDKMKTEFISITSHQMRTPLSTINWYLEALLTGQAGTLTADQEEFIKQINIGNNRMIKLVNSILNISRIEAGRLKIEPDPTDVVAWLKSEIKEVEPLAKQNNLTIEFTEPEIKLPLVPMDQGLWQQVVHNFLTNAVKYSINSKESLVKVAITQVEANFVISVKDSGIGIPKAAQEKIFSKFYRAKNAMHSDADGTGLGLYVAKMIADLVGGKIWFESIEDQGTTFFASLPLAGMQKRDGDRHLEAVS